VGNIFQLGTPYTDALGVSATDRDGCRRSVVMGSYGIGISRLLATLVEQHHDGRGIALTAATASFGAHLVVLGDAGELAGIATDLYAQCAAGGIEILWDDRDVRAGEQLADADLIGAAVRVTLGRSTLKDRQVELCERRTGRVHFVGQSDAAVAVAALLEDLRETEEAAATR
jgi:prolyl-tRNA synthetase